MSNALEQLRNASRAASQEHGVAQVSETRLSDALAGAIDPQKLIDNCAEAWRLSADQAAAILRAHGFGGVLARLAPAPVATGGEVAGPPLASTPVFALADGRIRLRAFSPAFDESVSASPPVLDAVNAGLSAFTSQARRDPLAVLYRDEPLAYAEKWLREDGRRISEYVRSQFGDGGPTLIVNSGIGANEQFNHLVSRLFAKHKFELFKAGAPFWVIVNSPKELTWASSVTRGGKTLFMEFSRSGITEETVKVHEFTPRDAKRIVFANTGPLRALAERDGNLLLSLPDEVSGRYGRNKTPILMAPMFVAGMDVAAYWRTIQDACDTMDLSDRQSAPVAIAQWIRIQQLRRGANHIYLGTNDDLLRCSADEFCQFWNEGVNRDGNDITMSRYLGLPRDSHMNLEAILGTSERKIAIFLLNVAETKDADPDLVTPIDPLRPEHAGLTVSKVDLILALANAKRCSEKMPTLLITVNGVDFAASAWLGQLWADITLVYSRLIGVDPGSNPEVKNVRTRAAQWLADQSRALNLLP